MVLQRQEQLIKAVIIKVIISRVLQEGIVIGILAVIQVGTSRVIITQAAARTTILQVRR